MRKKNWMIAIVLTIIVSNSNLYAQVKPVKKNQVSIKNANPLLNLKKVTTENLDPEKKIMLDPARTPIYSENHVLIDKQGLMTMMISGDYVPEPYIDSNKNIKAFLLRKATEQEKMNMKQMVNRSEQTNDLIGKKAFPFTVTDIFGNNYSLQELKGKVLVINFWFAECKPCVMEMPELNALVDKYKNNNDAIFLGFTTNDKSKINQFLKTKTFKYNIIPDSKQIAELYNVNSYPTHIIIDKNSTIMHYTTGLAPNTIKELDEKIEEILTK